MLFMVVERFEQGRVPDIYRRLAERGRSMPEGLEYEGSWIDAGLGRCWQLMRCEDATLLQRWVLEWQGSGIVFEEVVPVVPSAQVRAAIGEG
jgi:hypothetical protein